MEIHNTEYWNDDADKYRQLADLLKVIAEKQCGVLIDATTHARWQDMMGLMTEVDAYIDERIVPGFNTEADIVDELERFDRFRERYPHIAPEAVGEQTWKNMERTAREVVGQFQELAFSETYGEYVEHRRDEAIATAELFSACATDVVKQNPAFEADFMDRLKNMATSACLIDSANDLAKDFHEGRSVLPPTIPHRMHLFYDGVVVGVPQMDMLKHMPICREIGRAAIMRTSRKMGQWRTALGRRGLANG